MRVKPVVYIDVLFFVNFFINFILLCTASKLLRLKTHPLRLILAASLGALYAVLVFYPRLGFFYTSVSKILSSFAICAVAFNIKGIKLYIKAFLTFLLVTLAFGGGIFAIMCFTGLGAKSGMFIKNGIVYMNLPWKMLILSAFILYLLISRIKSAIWSGRTDLIDLTVTYSGHTARVKALPDTGNALCDPITSAPVIVAELKAVSKIVPHEFARIFESENESDLSDALLSCKIRLIPFASIGCENGMLWGFKPDKVEVFLNERNITLGDVIIGVCRDSLSADNSFHALIHPEIIS